MSFLKSLVELDIIKDSDRTPEKFQMRERKAAAGLFNWEVELPITKSSSFPNLSTPKID